MGVLGLWQLLAPVGQPVALESLENKIFAVDISIWLNQALKGYRDSQGGAVANAHLLSLFSRLCKLLFYKIRPIIVFDGGFPELKKQTIINRHQRRAAIKQSSRDIGLKILTNYLASQNLASVGGESTQKKAIIRPKEKVRDEIFVLPPLPDNSLKMEDDNIDSIDWKFTNFSKEDIKYLSKIDINSDDFNNLPPDVKQEILSTLKESRKHRTWDQYEELPQDSNDFSSYQMQNLLKKRTLSRKLEEVQKDMRQINTADFVAQYTSDHVIGETNKIMSDDCSHYVLLKKIIQQSRGDENKNADGSTMLDTKNAFIKDLENIDVNEYSESNTVADHSKNASNIKSELTFDYKEEDVDNPPVFIKTESLKTLSSDLDIKQSNSSISNSDAILISDDEEEIALAVQLSLEQSNPNSSDYKSSLLEADSQNETNVQTIGIVGVRNEISSRKSEIVPFNVSGSLTKDTICLSSSDDEIDTNINNDKIKTVFKNLNNSPEETVLTFPKSETVNVVSSQNTNSDNVSGNSHILNSSENFLNTSEFLVNVGATSSHQSKSCASLSSDNLLGNETSKVLHLEQNKPFLNDKYVESFPSTSSEPSLTPQEKAEIAQKNLQFQEDLESATALLEANKAKQDRQNRTVQEHMVEECKELLQLFGVPYIVSPTEAEAQCAFYDYSNLTHGTITDDSDVWLFGGKRVYKNFFTQQKYVEFYKDHEIFTHFGLSRKKLINFAMLTGSDYTEGIEGVGPVTATEILSEFPDDGLEALYKFKEWWARANKHACPPENKVRAKLIKLVLGEKFPDERITDAYLNPTIDDSTEKFTWGRPDLDALRDYTRERFGWNKSKVDEALLPVIKKLSERDTQTHIDNFFTVSLKKQTNLFPSKRIMSALKKLTSPQKESSKEITNSKAIKRKTKSTKKKTVPKKIARTSKNFKKADIVVKCQGPVLSEESSEDS
ncbi:DNA repair protein complementing XP-G cells homolog [Trichonephila clavipes]|nr:DNA repair protein complementing XP-G cells homolog [Trichonephila clavipes]